MSWAAAEYAEQPGHDCAPLIDPPHHSLSVDAHRYPNALVRSGFDAEVRFGIFPQSLNDECTDLSRNRPRHAFSQPHSIVGDEDAITILALTQTLDRNHAMTATIEGMLERVGQESFATSPTDSAVLTETGAWSIF